MFSYFKKTFGLYLIATLSLFSISPAMAVSVSPAYGGDFPDPSIMSDNGRYWAYSTGTNVMNLRVMSSSDMTTWSEPTDPLPTLPRWASKGMTWAPSVIRIGNNYVMYYTTHSISLNKQCISVATSVTPQGPFTDMSSGPLVCQTSLGGSIDPHVYRAPNGNMYLYWKSDGSAVGQVSSIWGRQLATNGLSFKYSWQSPTKLLSATSTWQNRNVESPSVTYYGGKYYLFYSGNLYDNPNYGIGYATCSGVLGKCTDMTKSQAWIGNDSILSGPGMGNIFTDSSGALRMSYHSWQNGIGYHNGGFRPMWIDRLNFVNGVPQRL